MRFGAFHEEALEERKELLSTRNEVPERLLQVPRSFPVVLAVDRTSDSKFSLRQDVTEV